MKQGIDVRISYQGWSGDVLIAIFKNENGQRYIARPVELVFEPYEELNTFGPTMTVPEYLAKDLMKALAEELDQKGIKTENDFKIQGLLEAKESHLQDMRKLVFKNENL